MNLGPADWQALILTLELAFISTGILLVLTTPLAWWLSRGQGWIRQVTAVIAALPLVLPPTVLGFYLLVLLSPDGFVGTVLGWLGIDNILFTFSALVLGSLVYSFPFVLQPIYNGFVQMGKAPLELAQCLNTGFLATFFKIVLPICRHSFISAFILGFAHTLGEFGVVLMIGGSVPGQTQVVSIALFEHVETLNYASAHQLSFILLVVAFLLLLAVYRFSVSPSGILKNEKAA